VNETSATPVADFGPSGFTLSRAGEIDNFDVAPRTHAATFGLAYKFGGFKFGGSGGSLIAN
jgi:hypothetical protein